jgi:hypothetical protein
VEPLAGLGDMDKTKDLPHQDSNSDSSDILRPITNSSSDFGTVVAITGNMIDSDYDEIEVTENSQDTKEPVFT